MSETHRVSTETTPEGFRGHYECSSEKIDKLQKSRDGQFDKSVQYWVAGAALFKKTLLKESVVDRDVSPKLIASGIKVHGHLRGPSFHKLYVKAMEGDVMPLVNYCVARKHSRDRTINYIQGVTDCRLKSVNDHLSYLHHVRTLEEGTLDIAQDASDFRASLTTWGLLKEHLPKRTLLLHSTEQPSSKRQQWLPGKFKQTKEQ